MSARPNERKRNPPEEIASSRPSFANRSSASRMGVREAWSSETSPNSVSRSPGENSPFKIRFRKARTRRSVCLSEFEAAAANIACNATMSAAYNQWVANYAQLDVGIFHAMSHHPPESPEYHSEIHHH